MKLSIKTLAAAATLVWASASQAVPMQYNFQYTASGGLLAGSLIGDLQGDGNTIVVSSFLDFVTFNGVPGLSLTFVESLNEFFGGPVADPTVSLDGLVMDVIACDSPFCTEGFLFGEVGGVRFDSSSSFGALSEGFNADNWQIRASVPEPGSLALVGLALAGLGALRRRA